MLALERDDPSLFNVQYLNDKPFNSRTSRFSSDESSRGIRYGLQPGTTQDHRSAYITLVNQYITLIPEEWKLPGDEEHNPTGEYPEKWLFTIADDHVLLRAEPLALDHELYPVAVTAPDTDGHSPTPVGRIEMVHGLQTVLNWLFNSHIANVRKALNDMFVVDPSMIVLKDLENPEPGKLIRLRRGAWGRGVKEAITQLKVTDVTQGNVKDAQLVMDIMQRVSAATDATQGIIRSGGERRSATEYRMTVSSALSRLEHMSRMISEQYMTDVAYFFAAHTQQFMSEDIALRVLGRWPETLTKIYEPDSSVTISPYDLFIDYDIEARDGTIPSKRSAGVDTWIQLFQIIGTNEQLTAQFDTTRIFAHIATMLGEKNVFDFVKKGGDVNAVAGTNEEIAQAVDRGQLLPLIEG